jgi:hypothetical protein
MIVPEAHEIRVNGRLVGEVTSHRRGISTADPRTDPLRTPPSKHPVWFTSGGRPIPEGATVEVDGKTVGTQPAREHWVE